MTKKLFIIQLVLLIVIAVLHSLAEYNNFYWIYKWVDIPMHFLGGVWVSIFALCVYLFLRDNHIALLPSSHILFVFIFVVGVAFGWELLEVFIWHYSGLYFSVNYIPDTLLDLVMDFLGMLSVLFIYNRVSDNPQHTIK